MSLEFLGERHARTGKNIGDAQADLLCGIADLNARGTDSLPRRRCQDSHRRNWGFVEAFESTRLKRRETLVRRSPVSGED